MVFTPEQKIKIVQFWDEAKSYITVRRLFCHKFELPSRDAPSSKVIMIFVQHLDSTGTVHTAQHTQQQFSGHHVPGWHRFRVRVSRRKPPKNVTATIHRS